MIVMGHYLLIGAGFSRNWGGPLSDEVTGSLLGELHDDVAIANALRRGPFEDAFAGFHSPAPTGPAAASQIRFQRAVIGLFARLNKTFVAMTDFNFSTELHFSVKRFLAKIRCHLLAESGSASRDSLCSEL
jgi:hypothetical protein